ncbi:MAG: archease [Candidatus Zixiibacteriota bacterium]
MKTHKVLPHTADVRMWVESDTRNGLFEEALIGMAELIKKSGLKQSGPKINAVIELEAPDQTSLLIDFLSAVLTLGHQKKAVFTAVKFDKFSETALSSAVTGFETDGFDEDIKAVTYHEAEIEQNQAGRFETIIVFDI